MARRYLLPDLPAAGSATLEGDVGHHVGVVMRARPGAELELFDGRGHCCRAVVRHRDGARVHVDVGAHRAEHRGPAVAVELAFGLPKGNRADWLFEHATEVGVAAFRPLLTARTEARPNLRERWLRIARAATAQCDRSHLPVLHPPASLAELLAQPLPPERYVATAGGARLQPAHASAILVVGPPGGLADDELRKLAAAGFDPRGLGPLTLRTETAALAGACRLL